MANREHKAYPKSAGQRSTSRGLVTGVRRALVSASLLLCSPLPALAQERPAFRLADTSSPRATLRSFIDACNEFHELVKSERYFDRSSPQHRPLVRRILDCLDDSEIPEYEHHEQAGEAAISIKEILDRIELPPESEIPDADAIEAAGGPDEMKLWRIPQTRLVIAAIDQGSRAGDYLFSADSVTNANDYFEELRDLPYRTTGPAVSPGLRSWYHAAPGNPFVGQIVDRLPNWFRQQSLGLVRWKWIGLLVGLLLSVTAMTLLYAWQLSIVRRYRETSRLLYCISIALPIGALLVPFAFNRFVGDELSVRGGVFYFVSFGANIAFLIASLVVVVGVSNRIAEMIIASPRMHSQGINAQFIRMVSRVLAIAASAIIFLEVGQHLGIPITTLLASAGVGGLAVALAAQHALKNVIGTMMLMADKPFRVGDRILVQGYDGVVEQIGLRSTRVRLLSGHVLTMPNDELADHDVENIGSRPHIRRVANIHIPLDTPQEKIERSVAMIRAALADHEGMDPEFPPRVFFHEFNPDSFNLRVWYWYSPPNYWDYLAFSQQLNLEICRIFKEQGIRFYALSHMAHTSTDGTDKPIDVRVSDR